MADVAAKKKGSASKLKAKTSFLDSGRIYSGVTPWTERTRY